MERPQDEFTKARATSISVDGAEVILQTLFHEIDKTSTTTPQKQKIERMELEEDEMVQNLRNNIFKFELPHDIYWAFLGLIVHKVWDEERFSKKYRCLYKLLMLFSLLVQLAGTLGMYFAIRYEGINSNERISLFLKNDYNIVNNVQLYQTHEYDNINGTNNTTNISTYAYNYNHTDIDAIEQFGDYYLEFSYIYNVYINLKCFLHVSTFDSVIVSFSLWKQ